MQVLGIGSCKTIDEFVDMQTASLKSKEQTFESVYEIMFSLRENVMFETTDGNKIYKKTYGEVSDNVEKTANALKSLLSLEKGSIVGLYMDNSVEWIEIFWAILRLGYVPLLMNKRIDAERLESVLSNSNTMAVISDSKQFSVNTVNVSQIDKNAPIDSEPASWANEIILMSSGSTNDIKLCVYNGSAICEQIYNSADIIKKNKRIKSHYNGYIKQLTFLPFYHVFGLVACYMWFAFFARTFVLLNNLSGETIISTVKKHQVTHIFAVPMLWERIRKSAYKLLEQRRPHLVAKFKKGLKISNILQSKLPILGVKFAKRSFKEIRENLFGDSIQFLITGGGAISTKTLQFFNGIGYHLANGYGMTEIGIASVELSVSPKKLNSRTVGRSFASFDYRINESGLLEVKSKSIASKIITRGEAKEYTENDWFETNDAAQIRGGRLYILGRGDDMIVASNGENVAPCVIEDKIFIPDTSVCMLGLESHGKIKSTLIVGISKYFSNQKISDIKEQLFEIIRENGYTSLIDDICFTYDDIMTENEFKLNRTKIKNRILSGELRLMYPETFETEVLGNNISPELLEKLCRMFSNVLEKKITAEQASQNFFFELGGSSLAYFQLIEDIKSEFNVPFPIVDEQSIVTVNDFCMYLQDRI